MVYVRTPYSGADARGSYGNGALPLSPCFADRNDPRHVGRAANSHFAEIERAAEVVPDDAVSLPFFHRTRRRFLPHSFW